MQLPGTAAAAVLLITLTGMTAPSDNGSSIIAAVDARNATLASFTFKADVAVAMHHFPWMHFRLSGEGRYRRGDSYIVHFTKMPWFASHIHDVDLSMIDPTLWPKDYSYSVVGTEGVDTIFALQALHDPTLTQARVALNEAGADWVDATYTDGMHIHMAVTADTASGYLLPSKLDVAIDAPHMPLSAQADFSHYQISSGSGSLR